MWTRTLTLMSVVLLGPGLQAQIFSDAADLRSRLFVATADGPGMGEVVEVKGGPPWETEPVTATDGGRTLRSFGKELYVINSEAGTITRVARDGGPVQIIDLGPDSQPQDVHVVRSRVAYITRRDNPFLHRFDLEEGWGTDVVDLRVLAEPDEIVSLGTLERHKDRLFVQVRLDTVEQVGLAEVPVANRGVLGVVDITRDQLIDVDSSDLQIQGIRLTGAPPRLKMQIVNETKTLFVSTTDGRLDQRGGIEMVDLVRLESRGFAISERQHGADLGGFVMTSAEEGFLVFHTDIAPSTHLQPFTIEHGVPPGPEIFFFLGDFVDRLAYDPVRQWIFLPTAFGDFGITPGVYVFDAITHEQVGPGPIDTGMKAHDVIVPN